MRLDERYDLSFDLDKDENSCSVSVVVNKFDKDQQDWVLVDDVILKPQVYGYLLFLFDHAGPDCTEKGECYISDKITFLLKNSQIYLVVSEVFKGPREIRIPGRLCRVIAPALEHLSVYVVSSTYDDYER